MHRLFSRLPRILLVSNFAVFGIAAAEPAPPAPVPYPNAAARDPASGLPTGKRMHKPYTAQSVGCAANTQPLNVASDPEEGGQIARKGKAKPSVSDISVTKKMDTASPTLADSTPSTGAPC